MPDWSPSAQGLPSGSTCLPIRTRAPIRQEILPSDSGLPRVGCCPTSHLRFPRAIATGSPSTEAQREQPASTILCPLTLQEEQQLLRQADFKKWLHHKALPRGQSLIHSIKQEPQAPPWAIPVSKTPKLSKHFHLFPKEHLQQTSQPKLQPSVSSTPHYRHPTVRQPKPWNISNNPARSPTAQIGSPQGIRLGVNPDPSLEHDLSGFLKIRSDGQGGTHLHTVTGKQVAPVPRLPLEVIVRELYPHMRPCRMKVPQGFHSVSIQDVDRKRYLGDNTFWTDTLAMNLRETFDEAFLATVQAHQGLPILPCP